jgi:hypothetical protein
MANEFKVRKGLVVNGSGSVILDVQGSQGQLFSVTDQLSGSLFAVNDISGIPVMEAFSDTTVRIGQYNAEAIIVSGSNARITGSLFGTASWANNAVTASYILNAASSSYALSASYAQTSSFVNPLRQDVLITTGSLNVSNTLYVSRSVVSVNTTGSGGFAFEVNGTGKFTNIGGTLPADRVGTIFVNTVNGGSGAGVSITGNTTTNITLDANGNSQVRTLLVRNTNAFTSTTIEQNGITLLTSVSQSFSASYAGLKIAVTETATGSVGSNYLINALAGPASTSQKFYVDNTGSAFFSSSVNIGNNLIVTGSLNVTNGITGSLFGTASWANNATTASFVLNAVSSSFATSAATATTASYILNAASASYALSSSYALNASTATSASFATNAATAASASFATNAANAISASYATFAATASSADNFNVRGTLTATTLVVQTITSSTDFVTGSTRFGSLLSNTHQFTGSVSVTGSLTVSGVATLNNLTGSLFGTASWASNAVTASIADNAVTASRALNANTASYVLNAASASYALSASYAQTSSFVNTLNQSVIVTSYLAVGTSSLGATENTLVVGPSPAGGAGEGGQILLQAKGDSGYTSASMLDVWQNQFRILRGTNASSDGLVAQWNLHSKQVQFPAYTGSGAFTGTAVANLAVDSAGNILTVATGGGGGSAFPFTGSAQITGSLGVTGSISASGAFISLANGAMYFRGGDDAELWDINVANTLGVYGQQNQDRAGVKLGSAGPTLFGSGSNLGINMITPTGSTLTVNGNVWATSFTGSLLGTATTASYVLNAVSSSFATNAATATSASYAQFANTASSADNFNVRGTLTATTLVVQTITSSVVFSSGSNRFGNDLTNTQTFTGSLLVTGSNHTIFGNVGIGTTSPLARIHEVSNGLTNLILEETGAGNAAQMLFRNTARTWDVGADSSPDGFYIHLQNGNQDYFFINPSGSIGIGTTVPNSRLNVSGSVSITGSLLQLEGGTLRIGDNAGSHTGFSFTGGTLLQSNNNPITFQGALRVNSTAGNANYISGSGGLAIGKTTANSYLDVNGNTLITGSLTVVTGSAIEFQVTNTGVKIGNSATDIHTATGSLSISGSTTAAALRGSGSAVFSIDGTSGRLFQVDDSLTGSLFSVNTAGGLPVIEAFSDNTVRIGQFGRRALFVSQSAVGIGKETLLNGILDVSGSVTISGSLTVVTGSGIEFQVTNTGVRIGNSIADTHTVTGSINVSGSVNATSFTGSLLGTATTASYVLQAVSASFATSAANATSASYAQFANTASSADNFNVRGTLTATTLVVQTITSSIIYSSGSNRFGNDLTNTQTFTGSLLVTGSNHTIFGNVGIGSTSPTKRFTVRSTTNDTTTFAGFYAENLTQGVELWYGGIQMAGSNTNVSLNLASKGAESIIFNTNATERMRIVSGGNVGIGTTSPVYRLEVNNSTEDNHIAAIGSAPSIQFASANTNPVSWGTIGMATTTNNFIIGAVAGDLAIVNRGSVSGSILFGMGSSASSEKVRITPAGNVGIGTSTPTLATLQVNGNVFAASFTGSFSGSFAGSITNATSASYAATASVLLGSVVSASYAQTASFVNPLVQSVTVTGISSSFTNTSTIDPALRAINTTISATPAVALFISGSTIASGSFNASGSLNVNGPSNMTGSLTVTGISSSFINSTNAIPALRAINTAISATPAVALFVSGAAVVSGSIISSGSLSINGLSSMTGSLTVTGISSSFINSTNVDPALRAINTAISATPAVALFISGSTISSGSFNASGSLNVNGPSNMTGSLTVFGVSSSFVNSTNAIPALRAINTAISATPAVALFVSGATIISGSTSASGSLSVNGSSSITGSLNVSAGITGSLFGTASFAVSASWAPAGTPISASYAATASFSRDFTVGNTLVIDATLTDYASIAASSVGSNNLFSQNTGSYTSAFFKYTCASASFAARSGEVVAVWNGTSAQFTDFSTVDIGNTTPVTASVAIVSGQVQFNMQTNTSGWAIKSMATFI